MTGIHRHKVRARVRVMVGVSINVLAILSSRKLRVRFETCSTAYISVSTRLLYRVLQSSASV